MSSLHLEAKIGDIAETVLLPGDPLRAKFVAEHFLTDVVCYNKVRGMYGYTGYYNGKRISIQGTGMGMGSCSIYVHELINTYGAKKLVRVGTCGALQAHLDVGQVILVMSASGDSDANLLQFKGMHYAATADFDLLIRAYHNAQSMNIQTVQGTIFSTNTFYDTEPNRWEVWQKHGILACDMESQALFTLSNRFNVKALSLLTVSDNIVTGAVSSQMEREKTFNDMMRIALSLG
jgi:purine-nucleoside phosphorylase